MIKIRSVGLNSNVARMIEKNLRGLKDCFDISNLLPAQAASIHKLKRANAIKFINLFVETLKEQKVSQKL